MRLVLALLVGNLQLSITGWLFIIAVCSRANTIGVIVPCVARKFALDSAPLITTLVDATGLAISLLIARALLGLEADHVNNTDKIVLRSTISENQQMEVAPIASSASRRRPNRLLEQTGRNGCQS